MLSRHLAIGNTVAIPSGCRRRSFIIDLALTRVQRRPVRVVTTNFNVVGREFANLQKVFVRRWQAWIQ